MILNVWTRFVQYRSITFDVTYEYRVVLFSIFHDPNRVHEWAAWTVEDVRYADGKVASWSPSTRTPSGLPGKSTVTGHPVTP